MKTGNLWKDAKMFLSIHLSPARVTVEENIVYILKQEKKPIIFGEPYVQGKRNDLVKIKKLIQKGETFKSMMENEDLQTKYLLNCSKQLLDYFEPARKDKLKVIRIYRPSRRSKSFIVRKL